MKRNLKAGFTISGVVRVLGFKVLCKINFLVFVASEALAAIGIEVMWCLKLGVGSTKGSNEYCTQFMGVISRMKGRGSDKIYVITPSLRT